MQNKQRLNQSKYRIIKINDLDYKAKKKNMELMVRGEGSQKGIKTTDFRGEEFILTDWRSPTEPFGGMTGKVYCQTREEYEEKKTTCYEWYPSVIGGIFEPAE